MHVVSPSRWLAAEAQRSTLLGQFDISVIPYGLNTHTFAPLDRASVRQSLGLPQDAALVLFAAAALDNRRKGLDLLTAALGRLATKQTPHRRPVHLLTIGDRPPTMPFPLPHHHLGATNDDRRLAEAYNAADVFVIPSRDDNLPNTVLESLACGTPVVGFAVGGIPDMVRMGETGLLAAPEDTCAMAEAIERVLVDAELRSRLAENARRVAVTEYDAAIQAGRYAALYAQILESSGRDPSRALMGAT
jgi:glycosyltransferase involved in cell wall biosynthesis